MGDVLRTPTDHEPDQKGHWGLFGGRYVPEALMAVIDEVTDAYGKARADEGYLGELDRLQRHYSGRPSPLYEAERFGAEVGARVFLKREDLNHTGSHKINNVLGQALLAQRMGKSRVIAETGAGQHGVATATACALLGLECKVYMGAVDVRRQALNVARMRLLGAEVEAVEIGSATLKDAINEAMRDWVSRADDTYYAFGTAAGPHPFPAMVRDFQRIVGTEARAQMLDQAAGSLTRRSRASAAAPTRSACSIRSSTTPRYDSWAARPAGTVWTPGGPRPPSTPAARASSRARTRT